MNILCVYAELSCDLNLLLPHRKLCRWSWRLHRMFCHPWRSCAVLSSLNCYWASKKAGQRRATNHKRGYLFYLKRHWSWLGKHSWVTCFDWLMRNNGTVAPAHENNQTLQCVGMLTKLVFSCCRGNKFYVIELDFKVSRSNRLPALVSIIIIFREISPRYCPGFPPNHCFCRFTWNLLENEWISAKTLLKIGFFHFHRNCSHGTLAINVKFVAKQSSHKFQCKPLDLLKCRVLFSSSEKPPDILELMEVTEPPQPPPEKDPEPGGFDYLAPTFVSLYSSWQQ